MARPTPNPPKEHATPRVDAKRVVREKRISEGKCPDCGGATMSGFGLAGGGYGVYDYCPKCEAITNKVQVDE
jgi:ssDNA-binding Zn-finger/Zn-ribbon topoisomerase 1